MPLCKNDNTRTYRGDEPSPKGLGYCAHAEKIGTKRKGRDKNIWIITQTGRGVRRWTRYIEMILVTVSYNAKQTSTFPSYKIKLPKGWSYNGYERAMKSQPKWITNNAYFHGPKDKLMEAKKEIKKLYDKYANNDYIGKYVMKTSKVHS